MQNIGRIRGSQARVDTHRKKERRRSSRMERSERPHGAAARVIGTFSTDDPSVDLASIVSLAVGTDDSVSFSTAPANGEPASDRLGRRLAQELMTHRDYLNHQMLQRTRAIFDTVHHSVALEVLSRSGASIKDSVTGSFPSTTGGYDEWREKHLVKGETSANWWLANKEVVITKAEHLPTAAEKVKRAAEYLAWMDRTFGDAVHDLPPHLTVYPRPNCPNPPAHGESTPLGLQCDLERPVVIEDKQLYRVKVIGLAGTNGQTHASRTFNGKEIREAMQRTFKERKQFLGELQSKVDSARPGAHIDIDQSGYLVCGASVGLTRGGAFEELRDAVVADEAVVGAMHLAWSGDNAKTRKLVVTGLHTVHLFSRPARPAAKGQHEEADICATCLEDITGEAWRCGTCRKKLHLDCFDGWRRMCASKGCIVTCPNCRAEVGDA